MKDNLILKFFYRLDNKLIFSQLLLKREIKAKKQKNKDRNKR